MNQIQVIFLFASYRKLSKQERTQVVDIVRREYEKVFGSQEVEVHLEDGISHDTSEEIMLAIQKSDNSTNEASYRNSFAEGVGDALWKMKAVRFMGFGGSVSWQDGLLSPTHKGEDKESGGESQTSDVGDDYRKRAKMYQAADPKYNFEMLALPEKIIQQIEDALNRIKFERKVFQEWGLYAIMPSPVCALSFFGPSGTGKSLAADAIASYLHKKIIRTSYADIENKYVGEGPKNVSAVFIAAEEQDAVLLIDEADALLSKRLVNVQEASGQAINSMRAQLLISLERFHGVAVFTSNLVVNYDAAFLSRMINIEFPMPDEEMRLKIWENHMLTRESCGVTLQIPLADDVDLPELAKKYEIVGRDIRNATVDACVRTCAMGRKRVNMATICQAVEAIIAGNDKALHAQDHTTKSISLTSEQQDIIADEMQRELDEKKAKA